MKAFHLGSLAVQEPRQSKTGPIEKPPQLQTTQIALREQRISTTSEAERPTCFSSSTRTSRNCTPECLADSHRFYTKVDFHSTTYAECKVVHNCRGRFLCKGETRKVRQPHSIKTDDGGWGMLNNLRDNHEGPYRRGGGDDTRDHGLSNRRKEQRLHIVEKLCACHYSRGPEDIHSQGKHVGISSVTDLPEKIPLACAVPPIRLLTMIPGRRQKKKCPLGGWRSGCHGAS